MKNNEKEGRVDSAIDYAEEKERRCSGFTQLFADTSKG